ncbi:helix-turn-helix transcriptional regulator [Paenibacillus sp.]|uniref:helix-turn-helix domain-containing protein n=1 Tax=Paenibacillus sp. TaxID=58172 RepID=UPI002819DDA3|nr:helix-turn-helix transcriptional regulator [Paenibacillus sp.]MDR0270951.1 helix-turn-helix domain-containing protein [Paenibacillus sp.]
MNTVTAKPRSLGELIQYHRKNKNFSLSKLQDVVGIDKGSLSRIENGGVKRPDFQSILSIAAALDIPHNDIVEQYIELGHKSEVIYSILQNELATIEDPPLISKIAFRFLESPNEDSFELVKKLYQMIDSVEDTSIQLSLCHLIIDYSRSHGIMPYIAKGLYRKYMIERNDFSKLKETYQSGKNILDYANFLSDKEKIIAHYSLAVHAYNLMLYEECINLSSYILENDEPLGEYKANAVYSIACSYHYLGQYEQCQIYLGECNKFPFPYVSDNARFKKAITNGKIGNTELSISQLEDYLKNPSDYNLIYAVTELLNLYLSTNDLVSAEGLLRYEDWMIESINDERTPPIKKSTLAYYYLLKGIFLLKVQSCGEAFDCYIESAWKYMDISMYDKAIMSLLHISHAIIKDETLLTMEVMKKLDSIYHQLIKRGLVA